MTARDDKKNQDKGRLAAGFTLGGLERRGPDALIDALRRDGLTRWQPRAGRLPDEGAIERFRALVRETAYEADFPGARLVLPLDDPDRIGEIARELLEDPGYRAAGEMDPAHSGLAALSLAAPGRRLRTQLPFSWPLHVVGPSRTLAHLGQAQAVQRGLATIGAPPSMALVYAPVMVAEMVELAEAGGPAALLLRIHDTDAEFRLIRGRLPLDELESRLTTILLPLGGSTPAQRFSGFVYELSHNMPLDVAAWRSSQILDLPSPLVIASPERLRRARLTDTLPLLIDRLSQLPANWELAMDRHELAELREGLGDHDFAERPVVSRLMRSLSRSENLLFDRERDAATALARISSALDRAESSLRPDLGPRPRVFGMAGRDDPVVHGARRYTDVTIDDETGRRLDEPDSLVCGIAYTLNVAIRERRLGLTRRREDQQGVSIPGQSETASVWVVLSDESETREGGSQAAFELSRRFGELRLPVSGDCEAPAQFEIAAIRPTAGERSARLGIRLYHKLVLIDHIQVDIRILADSQGEAPAGPGLKAILQHPGQDAVIEALDPNRRPRALTISVSRAATPDSYLFAFVGSRGDEGVPQLAGTRKLSETQLNGYLAQFRDALLDLVFGPALGKADVAASARDSFLARVGALGSSIVTSLFSYQEPNDFSALGDMVRESLGDTSIVQVALSRDAKDFVFPWQILTVDPEADPAAADPRNLWGYRFLLEVKRCGDGAPLAEAPDPRSETPCIEYAYWHFANEAEHRRELQKMIGRAANRGQPIRLNEPPIETMDGLLQAFSRGGGNLLYVYAHGTAATPPTPAGLGLRQMMKGRIQALREQIERDVLGLSKAEKAEALLFHSRLAEAIDDSAVSALKLRSGEIPLTPLTLKTVRRRLTRGPIVFVNTCQSAQIWNAVEDSFVGLFLARGARAVIGTETTIPVVFADRFGQAVLSRLLEGRTVGEAMREARSDLLDQCNNPLGLAYAVYGAADARLLHSADERTSA